MKKLIPMFLSGIFMLAGQNVFASTTIENAEFSNVNIYVREPENPFDIFDIITEDRKIITRKIESSTNLVKVHVSDNEAIHFIDIAEVPRFLKELNIQFLNHELNINFDANTNTIEILTDEFLDSERRWQETQIIEPIDMDNINPDEWIDFWLISAMHSEQNVMSFSWFSSEIISVQVETETGDFKSLIDSVIGCNTEDIRVISDYDYRHSINIQDLKDNDIFSDDELSRLLQIKEIYGTFEEFHISTLFNSFRETLNSGVLSDEVLSDILGSIELRLSNE